MRTIGTVSRIAILALCAAGAPAVGQDLPSAFDLRDVDGEDYVTSVKNQTGGTCWCHGTMAALESNLLVTGLWADAGETGEPNLAEYHLDWWNGFNEHNNDDRDPPSGGGLEVHQGGDYRVAAAYMTRGEGAVRDIDGQSYTTPPPRSDPSFHVYYPRHVEWYTVGPDLAGIDAVKQAVMEYGAIGTCMYWGGGFYSHGTDTHYQPPEDAYDPNHSVAIIGWDDDRSSQAPEPGAWLCKNSWGSSWSGDGYFWISYYDKWAGHHPDMGAVSFRNVVGNVWDRIYSHDYHGWRATLLGPTEAFNSFVADGDDALQAVSFYTADAGVTYTATVYDDFSGDALGGALGGALVTVSGTFARRGFHTVDLPEPLYLPAGEDFYVHLELSDGSHAYDCTSDIPVLLGAPPQKTIVVSAAAPGESYYWNGVEWQDLQGVDTTANFCIKALAQHAGAPPQFSAALDVEWVYQNTPQTTQDRHAAVLAITLDPPPGPDEEYDVTMTEAEGNHFQIVPTADPWVFEVRGGRVGESSPRGTPYEIHVEATHLDFGWILEDSVLLTLVALGDTDRNGYVNVLDKLAFNQRLNGIPTGEPDRVFDLTGDGYVNVLDKVAMNRALNGMPIP